MIWTSVSSLVIADVSGKYLARANGRSSCFKIRDQLSVVRILYIGLALAWKNAYEEREKVSFGQE